MHTYQFQQTHISIPETHDIQKVYIELTSDCNFACHMCFRHNFSTPTGSMEDAVLERITAELLTLPKLREVVIGGLGEPLLHPRLQEVVSWIKERDVMLTLTTNGALIGPHLDFFLERGVDKIVFSCETGEFGHANEEHIFETIATIRHKKLETYSKFPEIFLLMVVTRENLPDLPRIGDRLRQSGVKHIFLSNVLPATPEQEELALYPFPEAPEVTAFKEQMFQRVMFDGVSCSVPNFDIRTERSCDFIDQHALVIRRDGEVAPCYRFLYSRNEVVLKTEKDLKACSFGNIQENNLLDIWNGRDYTWFRFVVSNSLYPSCLDCVFREGCSYLETQETDCWGNEYSCADCLWARGFLKCP